MKISNLKFIWQSLASTICFLMFCSHLFAQSVPAPTPKPGSETGTQETGGPADTLSLPELQIQFDEEALVTTPSSDRKMDFSPIISNMSPAEIRLTAQLTENGDPIPFGVSWRIYAQTPDENGTYPLIASGNGGTWSHMLEAGRYLVHASYGKASATTPIRIEGKALSETVILGAGGMRLQAQLLGDIPISANKITFTIHEQDPTNNDESLIIEDAKSGLILPLNAGTYLVESQYGNNNAIVRAEITVEEGKLTDATLYHRAAEMTLKLVNETGGEAIANTKWTLLSQNGDVIRETIGAFPEFILEEGEYAVIASHEGRTYNRNFRVEPGLHRDVEVLITGE